MFPAEARLAFVFFFLGMRFWGPDDFGGIFPEAPESGSGFFRRRRPARYAGTARAFRPLPLRERGLTKDEIRSLSKEAGLFTWDKPAYACLATRIPTGEPISRETLKRIEGAETALFRFGYRDFRRGVFHGAARALREAVSPNFETVLLDLAGR